ncbi:MAG: tetratricopeptide repeat protein [Bacteroidota bacterium]
MKCRFNSAPIFKSLFFTCFLFSSLLCTAQQNEIVAKLVKEGIALHDKGDYEAAIAKFDKALILDPYDYEANFEKASSLLYAGKYDESIAISKLLIEKFQDRPNVKGAYVTLGSAYDDKGNTDSALFAYNEGIKRFPDFYLLHFNKGLMYARQKKWDEAEISFYETMKLKPNHAGSLYYTSLMHEKSNKVAAIISGLTFLAVEPEGKRAKGIYEYMFELFGSFALKTDKGDNIITLSKDGFDKKDKENNFSMVNMMMGLTVASAITDSVKAKTDVAKLSLYMQMMTNSLSIGQKDGKGIYWKTYAPFLIAMKEKDQMDVFAHIASITSGNEENIKWINDNQDKLKAFYEWMDKYEWKK